MKLVSEDVHNHSLLPSGHPEVVKYDDKTVEIDMWKENSDDGRERKQDDASATEYENYKNSDQLQARLCDGDGLDFAPRSDKYDDKQDSISGRANEDKEVVTLCLVPTREIHLPENETNLYTDKLVTEIEPSMLKDCSKENLVKDIRIDEGMPSLDKISVGDEGVHHNKCTRTQQFELDDVSDLAKEIEVNAVSISDDLKSLVFKMQLISAEDRVAGNGNPLQIRGNIDAENNIVNDISHVKSMPKKLQLQELDVGSHFDISSFDRREDPRQFDQKHVWNAMDSAASRSQCDTNETDLETSMAPSAHEIPHQGSNVKDLSFDGEAESGRTTNNLDSSTKNASVRAKVAENADCQQSGSGQSSNASVLEVDALDSLTGSTQNASVRAKVAENADCQQSGSGQSSNASVLKDDALDSLTGSTQNASVRAKVAENADCQQSGSCKSSSASVLEDDALDSLTGSTRSFFIQHGLGESSFAGRVSVSGPLGSISFRSDSSATSTRSFAFPVLHSEWNASPIRMEKADSRHFKRRSGWRAAFLCCRF